MLLAAIKLMYQACFGVACSALCLLCMLCRCMPITPIGWECRLCNQALISPDVCQLVMAQAVRSAIEFVSSKLFSVCNCPYCLSPNKHAFVKTAKQSFALQLRRERDKLRHKMDLFKKALSSELLTMQLRGASSSDSTG